MLAGSVALAGVVRLPSSPVAFYADGGDTESFFVVTLSNVPNGFDVSNDVYPGYCASFRDIASPTGLFHTALLYDSTSSNLPSRYRGVSWSYINYILNHKQGVADDVQAAIWFFTDGLTAGLTPAAQAMINAATANGRNFVPRSGQVVAVIVQATDNAEIQRMIIEVPVPETNPSPCDDKVTGGGWINTRGGAKANFGVHGGIQHGNLWGGLNYIDHGTRMHVHSKAVTGYQAIDAKTRQITFQVTIDGAPGTAIVTVTDNGEPGTHDIFIIQLSNGYMEGAELGSATKKGGGGNIQLHKSRCKQMGGNPRN